YSERRATVFTTNLADSDNTDPNSIALQLGLRIRSRLKEKCDWVRIDGPDTREVGPHPSHQDIARGQESSPASPKNPARGARPQRPAGQARAQLKPREKDGRADRKGRGGRAGSQ